VIVMVIKYSDNDEVDDENAHDDENDCAENE
jgi:hypothetical protein